MEEIVKAANTIKDIGYIADKALTNIQTTTAKNNISEVTTFPCTRSFLRIGGLSGVMALLMATYGEHAFTAEKNEKDMLKKTFETGNKMHMIHSVALMCSPLCGRPYLTGTLLTTGILLYSGGCYAHVLTENTKVQYIIICGKVVLICAWLSALL